MLEPVGPLPASVYWRRRAIAIALVLLAVLLLWAIWPGGGDDGDRRNAAAVTGTASATPGEITATPPAGDPGRPPDSDPGSTAGTGGPGGNGTPTTVPQAQPAPPAAQPCGDRALSLKVAPARPAYPVGAQPRITLTVRNVSKVACTRDLGAALQEILLYRGTQRLWSSNDCFPEGDRAVTTLRPNQVVTSSVTWSGKSSKPGCAGTRTTVPAGTYALAGRIGTLTSARTRLILR